MLDFQCNEHLTYKLVSCVQVSLWFGKFWLLSPLRCIAVARTGLVHRSVHEINSPKLDAVWNQLPQASQMHLPLWTLWVTGDTRASFMSMIMVLVVAIPRPIPSVPCHLNPLFPCRYSPHSVGQSLLSDNQFLLAALLFLLHEGLSTGPSHPEAKGSRSTSAPQEVRPAGPQGQVEDVSGTATKEE